MNRKTLALMVALSPVAESQAPLFAGGAGASVVVDVLVAGPADARYELIVEGARRHGRLSTAIGPTTVSALESIEVPATADRVSATVVFFGEAGIISRCAPVVVPLLRATASCSPAFVVTNAHAGAPRLFCHSSCQPASRAGR